MIVLFRFFSLLSPSTHKFKNAKNSEENKFDKYLFNFIYAIFIPI